MSILLTRFHGLSETEFGYLISVNLLAGLMISASAPLWIARIDLRRAVAACLVIHATGLIGLGYASTLPALAVVQFVLGATGNLVASVSFTLLAETENPARVLGIRITSDVAMGGVFLAALPGSVLGLRGYVAALAVVFVIGAVIAMRLPRRTRPPRHAETERPSIAHAPAAWLSLLALVIFNLGAVGDWIFIGFFAERSGLPAGPVADVIAATLFASIIGSLGASHVAGRYASLWPQMIAAGIFLVSIPWLAATNSLIEFGVAGFAYNASWNFLGTFLIALVAAHDPSGRLSSLVPAAGGLGVLISPTMTGALVEQNGTIAATFVLMTIVAISLALYLVLAVAARRNGARETTRV